MAFSWLIRGGYQLLTIPGMILRVVDHLKKNNKKTSGFHEVDSFFLRFWESFHHPKCWVSIIISIVLDFHCPYWYNFGKPFGFKKKQWPVKNQKNPMYVYGFFQVSTLSRHFQLLTVIVILIPAKVLAIFPRFLCLCMWQMCMASDPYPITTPHLSLIGVTWPNDSADGRFGNSQFIILL